MEAVSFNVYMLKVKGRAAAGAITACVAARVFCVCLVEALMHKWSPITTGRPRRIHAGSTLVRMLTEDCRFYMPKVEE